MIRQCHLFCPIGDVSVWDISPITNVQLGTDTKRTDIKSKKMAKREKSNREKSNREKKGVPLISLLTEKKGEKYAKSTKKLEEFVLECSFYCYLFVCAITN
jgi:hypothetical protein